MTGDIKLLMELYDRLERLKKIRQRIQECERFLQIFEYLVEKGTYMKYRERIEKLRDCAERLYIEFERGRIAEFMDKVDEKTLERRLRELDSELARTIKTPTKASTFLRNTHRGLSLNILGSTFIINRTRVPIARAIGPSLTLLKNANRYWGAILVDSQNRLISFRDDILRGQKARKGRIEVYWHKDNRRSIFAFAEPSLGGMGNLISTIPENIRPSIFYNALQYALEDLSYYFELDDKLLSVLVANGGTGKFLLLMLEHYPAITTRMIDGYRTRFTWWFGRQEDYRDRPPQQLWDIPLIIAFHKYANTVARRKKLIDLIGGIEGGRLSQSVILTDIPLMDNLLYMDFPASRWGTEYPSLGPDHSDIVGDLRRIAPHDPIFSLTNGILIDSHTYNTISGCLRDGKTPELADTLKDRITRSIESALSTLGFQKEEIRIEYIMIYMGFPDIDNPSVMERAKDDLIDSIRVAYNVRTVRFVLFTGEFRSFIVRVFPDQNSILSKSIEWLGLKKPELKSDFLKYVDECKDAWSKLARLRIFRSDYINEMIEAFDKARQEANDP